MTKIYDGHAHLGTEEERRVRRENGVVTMACAGTPMEADRLLKEALRDPQLIPAVGLHPWHCQEYSVKEMLPYIKKVPVLGEIGMDSVWCQVPMDTQRQAFREQLDLAKSYGKPVVLHTKGMEAEIGALIREYENRYLVHWYSSMEHLDAFLELDCYFTLGPDLETNPAVQQVALRAPINRLLVETDGYSAVTWAMGDRPLSELPAVLKRNMELAAKLKGVSPETMQKKMEENFRGFIKTPLQENGDLLY